MIVAERKDLLMIFCDRGHNSESAVGKAQTLFT